MVGSGIYVLLVRDNSTGDRDMFVMFMFAFMLTFMLLFVFMFLFMQFPAASK